ncbi:MAG: ABC transporter permease, partial [Planctomycetota bacterium]
MTRKLLSDYGMFFVLLLLCVLFSVLTLKEQTPESSAAAAGLIEQINNEFKKSDIILVVGAVNKDSALFAEKLGEELEKKGFTNTKVVIGVPRDLLLALDDIRTKGSVLAAIAISGDVTKWGVFEQIHQKYPEFSGCKMLAPESYMWPVFLKRSNLLAIVDRIVVIALIAIGMTMVIITAGIDLSVGSLIALSAVIGTMLMKKMGGLQASGWVVLLGFLAGILSCGIVGALGGLVVARFKVAPFITTLGIMMMARGLAFMITGGFSIYQVPRALPWLGQGRLVVLWLG